MSDMSVEFSFDDDKLKQRGMSKENVYTMLKQNFEDRDLPCASDGGVLRFVGNDRSTDEGNMWAIIVALANCDWFAECASRCVFHRNGVWSDILEELPMMMRVKAKALRGYSGQYA